MSDPFTFINLSIVLFYSIHDSTLDKEFISPLLSLCWDTLLVPNFNSFFSLKSTTAEGCLGVPGPGFVHQSTL